MDINGVEYTRDEWEKCLRWMCSRNGRPFWAIIENEVKYAHAKAAPMIPASPDRGFDYFVAEALQHAAIEGAMQNLVDLPGFVRECITSEDEAA